MKTNKTYFSIVSLIAVATFGCGRTDSEKAMLTGSLCNCEDKTLYVEYYESGCKNCDSIHIDNQGYFEFNPDIKGATSNIRILKETDVIGAFIEKGKYTMLTENAEEISFEGDNVDKNIFFYIYENAFNKNNFRCDSCGYDSASKTLSMLEKRVFSVKQALAGISDNSMRERLASCVERTHQKYGEAIRILEIERDAAHFNNLLDSISPEYPGIGDFPDLDGFLTKNKINNNTNY